MRLDKYLKVSRIIKRRTVANQACDSGRVMVNGKQAKASYEVVINDVISVKFGSNNLTVKVISLDKHISKNEASNMYLVLSNEDLEVSFN